ncbi:MAG: DoxD-like family protein [Rhodospirillales bacterium]|nr:DoxD-like family protein [Rhodospirillales bacterium]
MVQISAASSLDEDNAPAAALLLRLLLGVASLAHAGLKLFTFTMAGTIAFYAQLGLPAFAAYATVAGELIGGVFLIAGVLPRLVAVAQLPILLGAIWVHAGNGWVFNAQGGGWEYPAFWAGALLVQGLLGDGLYALMPTRRIALRTTQPVPA